jgi:hypothetical protein
MATLACILFAVAIATTKGDYQAVAFVCFILSALSE